MPPNNHITKKSLLSIDDDFPVDTERVDPSSVSFLHSISSSTSQDHEQDCEQLG